MRARYRVKLKTSNDGSIARHFHVWTCALTSPIAVTLGADLVVLVLDVAMFLPNGTRRGARDDERPDSQRRIVRHLTTRARRSVGPTIPLHADLDGGEVRPPRGYLRVRYYYLAVHGVRARLAARLIAVVDGNQPVAQRACAQCVLLVRGTVVVEEAGRQRDVAVREVGRRLDGPKDLRGIPEPAVEAAPAVARDGDIHVLEQAAAASGRVETEADGADGGCRQRRGQQGDRRD
mmetsp:Transcript_34846/g.74277  ORF Transcript_34846/g.74277 Transcript_34846/m.74277 type:complete len:234 (+) Transcript_34846:160-861(+)